MKILCLEDDVQQIDMLKSVFKDACITTSLFDLVSILLINSEWDYLLLDTELPDGISLYHAETICLLCPSAKKIFWSQNPDRYKNFPQLPLNAEGVYDKFIDYKTIFKRLGQVVT